MLAGLASLIFIPLLAISIVHMAWAFGATYPVKDEKMLARTVAGFKNIEKMPPRLASFAVSLLAFGAGIWALALTDPNPSLLLTAGGVLLTLVFLVRGIIGYSKFWRELTPEEPFTSLDKKIYSPLFIFIGTGFLTLSALRIF
ncbi:MAG: DUF3995 domain-containing protein [Devosiaceae bacterium]|nr:DUF3995 domain-containing protein [Devosiaceae bacterium]